MHDTYFMAVIFYNKYSFYVLMELFLPYRNFLTLLWLHLKVI